MQSTSGDSNSRKRVANESSASNNNKKSRVEVHIKLEEPEEKEECNIISPTVNSNPNFSSNLLSRDVAVKEEENLDGKTNMLLDLPTMIEDDNDDESNNESREENDFKALSFENFIAYYLIVA